MQFFLQHFRLFPVVLIASGILTIQSVHAQLGPPTGSTYGGSVPSSRNVVAGIAWYGVLADGLAEAKRTGKPILLITAAAQCNGVPGMW
ncbi:thioredoxin family protein [Pirellulaceae bacterium]|nr:thioredoxin family protein [Pirellulaceae bacterium]